jgi:pyruvate/2-oxoglutarate dehydrogenase complex dihydrolipoamide dehydrogenase (E3) component
MNCKKNTIGIQLNPILHPSNSILMRILHRITYRFPYRTLSHPRRLHNMASTVHYDAIIVGSGQSGTPLASAFAAAGRKTAIVERGAIGGTCVNVGCTPTKTLVASGRVAHLAGRAADYGVGPKNKTPAELGIDMVKVRQRGRDIVTSFRGGSEARLKRAGVDVYRGSASFSGPKTLQITMTEAGAAPKTIDGSLIFLNTGERPARPDLPGLETVPPARVLDSTSILQLGVVPAHLMVVGGGYVGLEFGQLFRRLGAEVTIVQHETQVLPREDADVAEAMTKILQDEGITVILSADVTAVAASGGVDTTDERPIAAEIVVAGPDHMQVSKKDIRASHILLAAGRRPNTEDLRLDVAGVKTSVRGHIVVDDKLATSALGIFALGDVHGGPAFTHMSYDDYRILTVNLLPQTSKIPGRGEKDPLLTTASSKSRNYVPYVVYTDPQLGHVGIHERDMAAASLSSNDYSHVKSVSMPMTSVARALETDETRGLMKATVNVETGEILGFTCLGIEGGEVMAMVQTAMMGGLHWWDLEEAVWAHPSLAESLNNLFAQLK